MTTMDNVYLAALDAKLEQVLSDLDMIRADLDRIMPLVARAEESTLDFRGGAQIRALRFLRLFGVIVISRRMREQVTNEHHQRVTD